MTEQSKNKKTIIPVFPLPEIVLFPGMNLPLHIFEEHYKQMVSDTVNGNKRFGIVLLVGKTCTQVGTVAEIIDIENLEDGKMNILTEGKERFEILSMVSEEPYYVAEIKSYEDKKEEIDSELKKNFRHIRKLSNKALAMFDMVSDQELSNKLKLPEEPNELLYLVSANLTCPYEVKQSILESRSIKDRAGKVLKLLNDEILRLEVLLENKKTKEHTIKNGKLKI